MCGITGFIDFNKRTPNETLDQMVDTLKHRGPDDKGSWIYQTPTATIGLAQSRLSIIDLSQAGHQPMHYHHYTIVYNGEVYNFKEVRKTLSDLGHTFKSNSDTEVILHAFEEWGTACVDHFIGMFAFVLFDQKREKVFFFRDRAGVKPLYVYQKDGVVLFASELKCFHQHPLFEKVIDPVAIELYFDYGYVPSPHCIFKNTSKLNAGHWISLDITSKTLQKECYWNVHDFYKKEGQKIDYNEAKEQTHQLLKSAFNYRMVSDVPVGVFLSGGYDSTAVAAILQSDSTEKIKTFTIGFDAGVNEAPYAKETAAYLGTDHYEYYCKIKEAQEIIPDLAYYYDEPFADSSAIPTMLVSKKAKEKVTVALSADGGDEIFAGYNRYPKMLQYSAQLNKIPDSLKSLSSKLFLLGSHLIPDHKMQIKHKLQGVSLAVQQSKKQQLADLQWRSHSLPQNYAENIFSTQNDKYISGYQVNAQDYKDELSVMLATDYDMYLENDILTKVDRATMAVSLEGREPLLDHRILEFVAALPSSYKYDGITGKKLLKDIVYEYVPKTMMQRPKTGFSLPIYSWLEGDLSYLLDEYLNKKSIGKSNLFNVNFVHNAVRQFRNGNLYYKPLIWKLLVFQMWYDRWIN